MPPALGWTVLLLLFVAEVLLVGAVAWTGWYAAGWAGALVAGLAVLAAWGTWAAPKARHRGPVATPVTKALVVLAACGGLWWIGRPGLAVALGLFFVVVTGLALLPSVSSLHAPDAGREVRR